jgi:PadR family transcriptional regulator PadR
MGIVDADTLYGTINLLALRALADGPLHGLAIARRIHEASRAALEIGEGALYPALHRMERDGLIAGSWGVSESNRRARFYRLTAEGRRRLDAESRRWRAHAGAVEAVLEFRPADKP